VHARSAPCMLMRLTSSSRLVRGRTLSKKQRHHRMILPEQRHCVWNNLPDRSTPRTFTQCADFWLWLIDFPVPLSPGVPGDTGSTLNPGAYR
jgi:hypothetical protein